MKSTGIVRRIDNLGRFTIPREMLRALEISAGTPMEIYVDGPKIILRKHQPDTWSREELELALILACDSFEGKPLEYLQEARERVQP